MTEYKGVGYGRTQEEAQQKAQRDVDQKVQADRDVAYATQTAGQGVQLGFLIVLGPVALAVAMLWSMALRPLGGLLVSASVILVFAALYFLWWPDGSTGMFDSIFMGIFLIAAASGAMSGLAPSIWPMSLAADRRLSYGRASLWALPVALAGGAALAAYYDPSASDGGSAPHIAQALVEGWVDDGWVLSYLDLGQPISGEDGWTQQTFRAVATPAPDVELWRDAGDIGDRTVIELVGPEATNDGAGLVRTRWQRSRWVVDFEWTEHKETDRLASRPRTTFPDDAVVEGSPEWQGLGGSD